MWESENSPAISLMNCCNMVIGIVTRLAFMLRTVNEHYKSTSIALIQTLSSITNEQYNPTLKKSLQLFHSQVPVHLLSSLQTTLQTRSKQAVLDWSCSVKAGVVLLYSTLYSLPLAVCAVSECVSWCVVSLSPSVIVQDYVQESGVKRWETGRELKTEEEGGSTCKCVFIPSYSSFLLTAHSSSMLLPAPFIILESYPSKKTPRITALQNRARQRRHNPFIHTILPKRSWLTLSRGFNLRTHFCIRLLWRLAASQVICHLHLIPQPAPSHILGTPFSTFLDQRATDNGQWRHASVSASKKSKLQSHSG